MFVEERKDNATVVYKTTPLANNGGAIIQPYMVVLDGRTYYIKEGDRNE